MSERQQPQLPIGSRIEQADEALTARIDQAQAANGLSRTGWQIVNALHEAGTTTHEQLAELLRPFASAESLAEQISHLAGRELIESERGTAAYRLTDRGRQVHAEALATQHQIRWRAVQGVSESDYLTAVRVLRRIVENLSEGNAQMSPGTPPPEQGR
ncbi:hypothetical protein NET02_14865 [Thermomicrobiaceae bacterium CFH 74404]|uniref:HTH marR-type domain-containing protein n=1 Tax=Thermalbibacter longus TaxID=2951981 RepID=A0AA41WH97_9BACT|nr:hypothetical protein [Thermalbibacter longus]MCM8750430.1 hypothetical protein [Thermalbibacter longus]